MGGMAGPLSVCCHFPVDKLTTHQHAMFQVFVVKYLLIRLKINEEELCVVKRLTLFRSLQQERPALTRIGPFSN